VLHFVMLGRDASWTGKRERSSGEREQHKQSSKQRRGKRGGSRQQEGGGAGGGRVCRLHLPSSQVLHKGHSSASKPHHQACKTQASWQPQLTATLPTALPEAGYTTMQTTCSAAARPHLVQLLVAAVPLQVVALQAVRGSTSRSNHNATNAARWVLMQDALWAETR
jgi:FtsZ-interacting cell division protein ZipA